MGGKLEFMEGMLWRKMKKMKKRKEILAQIY